ncbi:MAG: L-seryl-tRNA(Sec) selenium transferase [Candidatus Aminicenantes bacterium]|nr:MAG: L-seryl-tRNA(Sec) selenium transferase [Candidatus Aminicenantes bacterium]
MDDYKYKKNAPAPQPHSGKLKKLPAVDLVLKQKNIMELVSKYGGETVTHTIRQVMHEARQEVLRGKNAPGIDQVVLKVCEQVTLLSSPSLQRVINATGVVLHTNLGRAPLGKKVLDDIKDIILGYSNLEFDLKKASRGKRNEHVIPLLKFITGAEDALVVNNNAAGLLLALHTLARDREVIISRGELIEIGGSFRIPEILAASGAKMVEVGTTNKTHRSDYENAVNENTALMLKVHTSNYVIQGFTEEVSLKELVKLAHSRDLPVLYDIGSGLLKKPKNLPLEQEPGVKTSIAEGADLVFFSGDKLMGGPQSGIIVGKKCLISRLNGAPMMRALRVGKLTLAALSSVIRSYFNDQHLKNSLPLFSMLEQSEKELEKRARTLYRKLTGLGVKARIVRSTGQCGGGSLPALKINSFAVAVVSDRQSQKTRSRFAEKLFAKLLELDCPVMGILRQGEILFDVLTLSKSDISYITSAISEAVFSH